MKVCETCGEPIAAAARTCPYCGTAQAAGPAPRRDAPDIESLDIERGLPTVDEALARLDRLFAAALARGTPLLRVVHGYGSKTGGNAPIRHAARVRMGRWLAEGRIRGMTRGEEYNPAVSRESRELQRRHPVLTASEAADRRNPGITFLET